ncbi:hypothetical protein GII36_01265 [Candidatus Mycosynbacter amalyticus]|uniref:Uncharacterized protein n=1 Tax=Candidatus Mycosynbacter amalyticus TaxID=2665156 RepID=A0A857MIU2_9BACT|nr:DUF5663 domain-containing protein [Candidatus Mycosynbacter amalyticus]QHN42476.1 hypothetical protein GII36_01265 [Candidatus Mycosynbacter amalyticus]
MFQLDDKFLQDVGLAGLPADQKQAFLEQVYASLEERVGVRLSEGLSDAQLEEFEGIIDRKQEKIDAWLAVYAPQYTADPIFQRIQQATGLQPDDLALRSEFAATKWLEVNRPNYRDVVAQVMNELKAEITQNRDAILGSAQAPQQLPADQQQPPMAA